MIGEAAATSEVALEIALTGVEKLAHLPDGIFHETGGLIHDMVDAARSTPLGEGDAVLKFGQDDNGESESQ